MGPDRVVPHGRHGQPASEIRAVQRARILDAFVIEVGRNGLEKAHVSAVCRAAGVSTKGFYNVFESKEQCLYEAFDEGAKIICQHGAAAFENGRGRWENRVRSALHVILGILSAHPDFSRLCIVEYRQADDAGRRRFNEVVAHCRDIFGGGRRPVANPVGAPAEAFEAVVVGSMLGPLADCVTTGRADRMITLVTLLTYMLAVQVVGEERAKAVVRQPVL